MKTITTALAALVLSAGAAFASDPVEGMWRTEPGDSGGYLHVSVHGCGNAICGVISKAINAQGEVNATYEHLDKRMIWDMRAEGGGRYGGGKIWAPDRGKTYKSKMSLDGDRLTVEGCVAFVCRAQTWTRVR